MHRCAHQGADHYTDYLCQTNFNESQSSIAAKLPCASFMPPVSLATSNPPSCTIALYTDPDRHALFVREADEAFSLGGASLLHQATGQFKSSYLDFSVLENALAKVRADAVWVGWGFVSECAEFADLCRDMGIVFIGPGGEAMRLLGDKISAKRLAVQAGIAVAPWSEGPVETLSDARHHAERLGFPLFIKATAGRGGNGMQLVRSNTELESAFESARRQAFHTFGDPTVFMEQLIPDARHVEVQIIADHHGATWAAGVRDCTLQRNHQKLMDEAPSPALSPEQDNRLRQAAIRLSQLSGYRNAGTVEFLYQPANGHFLFMEMNTRLQVEHPVTECTTGLDLVKLQIHVARGGRLEGDAPRTQGHAIELRLNAEDADNDFALSPGVIERLRILGGPGVRIDTGVEEGDSIPAEFDSTIAKIIAHGRDRDEALSRLLRALRESIVVIKGGSSNRAFLLELLSRPEIQSGQFDTAWLDRLAEKGQHLSRKFVEVALTQAAIEAYERELKVEQAQFYASALRGRPQVRTEVGHTVELRYRDHSYSLKVYRLALRHYRIEVDGSRIDARLERLGPFEYWLTAFGRRFHTVSVQQGQSYRIELDGVSHRIDRDDSGIVRAPSPAVVVSVGVKPGDVVEAGTRLVVLEAMKMEMQVVAPFSGRVRHVMAIPNVQVGPGTALLEIEPATSRHAAGSSERVTFGGSFAAPPVSENDESRWLRNLDELRQLMLGFDIDKERIARLLAEWKQFSSVVSDGVDLRQQEDEILAIFVDLCSLFRRNPKINDAGDAEEPSTESYLFSYLRMLDTHGDGLAAGFVTALRRAIAHYGVTTLDRSPELEETLLSIYKSHQRLEQQVAPIVGILQRRLDRIDARPFLADATVFAPSGLANHLYHSRTVPRRSVTLPANYAIAASMNRYSKKPGSRFMLKAEHSPGVTWPLILMASERHRSSPLLSSNVPSPW